MLFLSFPVNLKRFLGLALSIPAVAGTIAISSFNHVQAQANPNESAVKIRANSVEANSETGVITARGNVQIDYPARQLQGTSAQAQYFSREGRLILSGNVYVLQQGNSMQAETMTYLINEGRFVATPKANGQVESIYLVPKSSKNTNPADNPQVPQVPIEPNHNSVK